MSRMSELHYDILELLEQGKSFYEVAAILEIPVEWVTEVCAEVESY